MAARVLVRATTTPLYGLAPPRGTSRMEIGPCRLHPTVSSHVRARASQVEPPPAACATAGASFHPSNTAAELHGSRSSLTTTPCRRALPKT